MPRFSTALADLFRDSPVGVAEIGVEGGYRILSFNEAFVTASGWSADRIAGTDPIAALGDCLPPQAVDGFAAALLAHRPWREACDCETRDEDGAERWREWQLLPLGTPGSFLLLAGACTGYPDHFRRHSSTEQQLHSIMLAVQEGIQLWNAEAVRIYANPASERLLDGDVDILAGGAGGGGAKYFSSEGLRYLPEESPVQQVLRTGQPIIGQLVRVEGGEGVRRWISINAHPIRDRGEGEVVGVVTSTSDVTEAVETEARLKQMAHFDPLTQLPNRVLLSDRLHLAIARARRSGDNLAVCLLDLDGFKAVNDTLGHKAGDLLLIEAARRIEENIRGEDTAARLGGDEFAILLGNLKTAGECEQTLNRIVAAISAPYSISGENVRVSASVGVTLFPHDGSDADKLLRHADQAMYKAKQAGKNCFRMFDPGQDQRLRANRLALRKIEEAIDAGQFQLHCQPQVDCRHGRVKGVELLLRWNHPVLGLLSPAEFLPLVEQDDLIVRLGEWTIAEALALMERWEEAHGIRVVVGINLPGRQLHQKEFAERLSAFMAGMPPERARRVNFEIVESSAIDDINAVGDLVARGHALGARFALDDFGTGYSSLVHLRRLGIDALKIDQTFIADMLDDPMDLAIVQGVVGLASAFRCEVVAEGVQNIDQILILLELGCETMQGYGLARPMPVERFPAWLAAFSPDPRWQLASTPRPSRGDFQMLLAEATHRFWMDRLAAYVRASSDAPPAGIDLATSSFGRWYFGEGLKHYGHQAGYREIATVHRALHREANRLVKLCAKDRAQAAALLDGKLADLNARLLDLFKQLRQPPEFQERNTDA